MKQYLNIILNFLFFILEPEDSATGGPHRFEFTLRAKGVVYAGAVKSIFWIITAIFAGLGIAGL